MALQTQLDFRIVGQESSTLDLATAIANHQWTHQISYATGTGASSTADLVFSDSRTLAATSESLDVRGGLTSAFGSTLAIAKIKVLAIRNKATTTGFTLVVGNVTNEVTGIFSASGTCTIGPGGVLILTNFLDGYSTTAGTADLIKINSGSNSVDYDIVIIGSST